MSKVFFRPQLFELLDNWKGEFQILYSKLDPQPHISTKMEAYEFLYNNYPHISLAVFETGEYILLAPTAQNTFISIMNN